MSGFKSLKDRLTLLLGSNASDDLKLRPLLIYPSENPMALKNCAQSILPMLCKWNNKA